MPISAPIRLSKSRFVAGVQCLKRLYYSVHEPQLAAAPGEPEKARFDQGHKVGRLAQAGFPGGVLVDAGREELDEALAQTSALVADRGVPAIFEATFRDANVLVQVDVLRRSSRNHWQLIEVKSSIALKVHHLYDLGIQYHVLLRCGLNISSAAVMHLNRDYVYDGRIYDLRRMFTIEDFSKPVCELQNKLSGLLTVQQRALSRDVPPDVVPGPQCTVPYTCEFFGCCNPAPPEDHVSFLPRLSAKRRRELHDGGITRIPDIPRDFPLTATQRRASSAVMSRQPWISETLAAELSRLTPPLYFMDFESFSPPIPQHAGLWPYAQLPFQWSVHRRFACDAEPEHQEFLAEDDEDPRERFIASLCEALGERGRIIVYNQSFERQRLQDLARWLPEFEHRIRNIQHRLWDLHPFIKEHVYHPEFRGSYSLKAVVQALVPALSYKGLDVSGGSEAGILWDRLIRGNPSHEERQRLKSALREYCRRDTLGMVKILERLKSLCS